MTPIAQSVLDPAGPQARQVAHLFWFAFATATMVYLLTVGAFLWGMWRAKHRVTASAPHARPADERDAEERHLTRRVSGAVALTVLVLTGFLGYDFLVSRAMALPANRDVVTIAVTGHQWWWQVEYPARDPQRHVATANEIHVPINTPVVLLLTSQDVIHSLWVPNLDGKKDLVPGQPQSAWFQVDTVGVYRGQCAEFCGHQHAGMGLVVVAHTREDFARWRDSAATPQAPVRDTLAQRGEALFMRGTCVMCHAIEGTPAGSNNGPTLTHFATRRTIGAAVLPNTADALTRWIRDPHRIKPGTRMPPSDLSERELRALVAYLQALR